MRIILASTSATRQAMLRSAGVTFEVEPSGIDEEPIKVAGRQDGISAGDVAVSLAREKALATSGRHPDAIVIGADQILECDGTWLDKPKDTAAARSHLRLLSGRTHRLETGVVCARDGAVVWSHLARPELTMRSLSEAFIADVVAREGDRCLGSVGAYRLEGPGVQLFERIEGDYFAILGLPLLPLLGFLRESGSLNS